MKKSALLLTLLIISAAQLFAQDPRWNDTVWYRNVGQNIYMLKFSPDDRVIAAHGGFRTLFYETATGNLINKIESGGFSETHYFDNGNKLLMVNPLQTKKIEIYDANMYQLIDSMENDGEEIGRIFITKDQNFLVGTIKKGLRVWDLASRNTIRTKTYEFNEPDITGFNFMRAETNCDNSKIVCYVEKYYKKNGKDVSRLEFASFDFNNLELKEIKVIGDGYYKISPSCRYIAWGVPSDFGVEIYNFETNQLLRKLPVYGYTLTGVEFTPDEKYMVTSQTVGDNALTIWNIETGLKEYEYLPASYDCISASHNGEYLAGGLGGIVLYKLRSHTGILPTENLVVDVFPNPALDLINIRIVPFDPYKYIITDSKGSTVLIGNGESELLKLPLGGLSSGAYTIKITIGDNSYLRNFVIAR